MATVGLQPSAKYSSLTFSDSIVNEQTVCSKHLYPTDSYLVVHYMLYCTVVCKESITIYGTYFVKQDITDN